MKGLYTLIFLLNAFISQSQREIQFKLVKQNLNFRDSSMYVFCRGTSTKSKVIAQKFNKADTNITHVGIGVSIHKRLVIYNVTDNANSNNTGALVIDTLESFVNSPDVYYLSIWDCNVGREGFRIALDLLARYSEKKVFFDASFNISNDDTLYCSEFCAIILNKVFFSEFQFKPETIELNNKLIESILNRKILTYYPVDFFRSAGSFKKIFEYNFSARN